MTDQVAPEGGVSSIPTAPAPASPGVTPEVVTGNDDTPKPDMSTAVYSKGAEQISGSLVGWGARVPVGGSDASGRQQPAHLARGRREYEPLGIFEDSIGRARQEVQCVGVDHDAALKLV